MSTRTRPSTTPDFGGIDYRIDAESERWRDFAASVYRKAPDKVNLGDANVVEVQAFRPSLTGGGYSNVAVVAIVLHSAYGLADMYLSPAEAREIAIALIQSAAEGDALSA
jgi:hypothetical protein